MLSLARVHDRLIRGLVAALFIGVAGCARTTVVPQETLAPPQREAVALTADAATPDAAIAALLDPYTIQVQKLEVPIAKSEVAMTTRECKGPLGCWVVDAMRTQAALDLGDTVDIAVTNCSGLRTDLPAGDITPRDIFEVTPFENTVVVFEVSAAQLDVLAQRFAKSKGSLPVSNMHLTVESNGTLDDYEVGGTKPVAGRIYRVATTDYLADTNYEGGLFFEMPTPRDTHRIFHEALVNEVKQLAARGETVRPPEGIHRYTIVGEEDGGAEK